MAPSPSPLRLPLALLLALALCGGVLADEGGPAPEGNGEAAQPSAEEEETVEDGEEARRRPLLWVVEGTPTIYLFGTIHSPDERVTTLAPEVEKALEAADVVWTEVPMEMAEQMKMQAAAQLPAGSTLADVVPAEVYRRTNAFLESKGYPKGMLDRFKPWVVATTLQILDMLPQLAQRQPLDAMLYTEAKKAGKKVAGLETVEEQLGIFEGLTEAEQATFLGTTVDMLEEMEKEGEGGMLEHLTRIYLSGDVDRLHALMVEQYDPEDPLQKKLMKALLDDRNVRMVERTLARTAQDPEKTYFVAVGAAHYPGEKGILALLEKKGRTARRVGEEAVSAPATPAAANGGD